MLCLQIGKDLPNAGKAVRSGTKEQVSLPREGLRSLKVSELGAFRTAEP